MWNRENTDREYYAPMCMLCPLFDELLLYNIYFIYFLIFLLFFRVQRAANLDFSLFFLASKMPTTMLSLYISFNVY